MEDYESLELSPPMVPNIAAYGVPGEEWQQIGKRLVDEVWHVHIAMDRYEEDCRLMTGGHVIEHQPVLGYDAIERYCTTFGLFRSHCHDNNLVIDHVFWPDPYAYLQLMEEEEEFAEDEGCC